MSCPTMIAEASEPSCRLKEALDQCLLTLFQKCDDNLTSMQTLKYRILNEVATGYGLSFDHINHLLQTHIPVHPAAAQELKQLCNKFESINDILAQDFVEQDKLLKLIKFLFKNNHALEAQYLLAMDGMNGPKLSNGPCLDPKRYLDNLRYGVCGTTNQYEKPTFRGKHVWAVRRVYQELRIVSYDNPVLGVYLVMCQVLKDMAGIELPVQEDITPVEPRVMDLCVTVYKESMPLGDFTEWVNTLKPKIAQTDEEDGPSVKRKRAEPKVQPEEVK